MKKIRILSFSLISFCAFCCVALAASTVSEDYTLNGVGSYKKTGILEIAKDKDTTVKAVNQTRAIEGNLGLSLSRDALIGDELIARRDFDMYDKDSVSYIVTTKKKGDYFGTIVCNSNNSPYHFAMRGVFSISA